ncbi:MAG: DUF4129 domain-containing protein [Labedaea sp.]
MAGAVPVVIPLDIPVDIGRDEARAAAARELSDPAYHTADPSVVDRVIRWILDRVTDVFDGVASVTAGGSFGIVVLALVLALAIVVVRLRSGRIVRGRRVAPVFSGAPRTAEDHRREAEEALARGELGVAVRERFRAIARDLEQRGILDEVSGRTVDEIAGAAGRALPAQAGELAGAARLFDDVVYGSRPATVAGYRRLERLDDAVRHTVPVSR